MRSVERIRRDDEFRKTLWLRCDVVISFYDRCYCPLVKGYVGKVSPSFCNCSVGWIRELFETALKKPVKVEKIGTIKQGNKQCRFRVVI